MNLFKTDVLTIINSDVVSTDIQISFLENLKHSLSTRDNYWLCSIIKSEISTWDEYKDLTMDEQRIVARQVLDKIFPEYISITNYDSVWTPTFHTIGKAKRIFLIDKKIKELSICVVDNQIIK